MADFLLQFINNPTQVGSIIPSSGWLAEAMLSGLELANFQTIVEYGPGTGAITQKIYPRMGSKAQFIGVEPNAVFAELLREKYPRMELVRDYASQVTHHLPELSGNVDAVISGLPFTIMQWQAVEETIATTAALLKPGGHFRTFFYVHMKNTTRVKNFERLLGKYFTSIDKELVLRNVPPAITLKCVK